MRYPPHTVDITAEPVTPFATPEVAPRRSLRSAITQSLGADASLLALSLIMGVLFNVAIGAALSVSASTQALLTPPAWFVFLVCGLPALSFLCADGLTAMTRPVSLPFAKSQTHMKVIYAKRIHLLLLSFYFTAILVALCWSAASMPLLSKFFVSAVFAIALYALGQSIPSRRTSFVVSALLFLVVLVATQTFIVLKLRADSARDKQEMLDAVTPRPGAFNEEETTQNGGTRRRVIDPDKRNF